MIGSQWNHLGTTEAGKRAEFFGACASSLCRKKKKFLLYSRSCNSEKVILHNILLCDKSGCETNKITLKSK